MEEKHLKKLRKKFVKDEKIPIPIYENEEEKYFDYFLELYEDMFEAKSKFSKILSLVEDMGFEEYYQKYNRFKDSVINHVKNKESFKQFNQENLNRFGVKRTVKSTNRQFYTVDNEGKKWISIDFTKANFHALKYMNSEIVDNKETYEEWISQFEDHDLFGNLKSIRQVIFGNLNPKRHQTIQSYVLNQVMEEVNTYAEDLNFWIMGADEFMVEFSEDLNSKLEEKLNYLENEFGFKLKKEVFELKKNSNISEFGFIKKHEYGKDELLGVNKHFFAQAYKYYKKEIIHPYDLLFYHENQISTFLKALK